MSIDKNFNPAMDMIGKNQNTGELIYTIDESLPGKCRLMTNGTTCRAKIGTRGLCHAHYQRFRHSAGGELEKYGLPPRKYKKRENNGI